jgi:broad specificity phosphatase PhoE
MLFVVRHGERTDHSNDAAERARSPYDWDPYLTARGVGQAAKAG